MKINPNSALFKVVEKAVLTGGGAAYVAFGTLHAYNVQAVATVCGAAFCGAAWGYLKNVKWPTVLLSEMNSIQDAKLKPVVDKMTAITEQVKATDEQAVK